MVGQLRGPWGNYKGPFYWEEGMLILYVVITYFRIPFYL